MWLALPRSEAWLPVAVRLVNAVLVILLAGSLAQLTLAILSGWLSPMVRTVPMSGTSLTEPATPAGTINYTAIAAWHLFGHVQTGSPVAPAPPPVMPVTSLNLRLAGIFFITQGNNRALALIAVGDGVERGYRIGDSLPGGVRLEQIQRDRVVVSRQGRQEVLNLPKLDEINRPSSSLSKTPPSVEPMPEPGSEPESEFEPEPEPEPAPSSSESRVIDATAVAQLLRGPATARAQALQQIAFASPYVQDGQFKGFRLRPGRDRRLMQQLSLNSGDVITEVNGTRLRNPMQGFNLLREVQDTDRIDVRVLRDGSEIPLTFSLNGSVPQ